MEEPRRLSLPIMGSVVIARPATSRPECEASRQVRYERCLDSDMNDVLNHDTLSSTILQYGSHKVEHRQPLAWTVRSARGCTASESDLTASWTFRYRTASRPAASR
jgi:hypothetical protein